MAKIGDIAVCKICGKEYKMRSTNQKYCCIECAKEANRRNGAKTRKHYKEIGYLTKEERRNRKARKSQKAIDNIAVEARNHGMSYGQYVALKELGKVI